LGASLKIIELALSSLTTLFLSPICGIENLTKSACSLQSIKSNQKFNVSGSKNTARFQYIFLSPLSKANVS